MLRNLPRANAMTDTNNTDGAALLPVTPDEERCDICCRPREQHVGSDLQCNETTYFRPMPKQSHSLPGDVGMLQDALLQHNERLRSAVAIADREGVDTNWLAFRGQARFTLAEYQDIVNEARAAVSKRNGYAPGNYTILCIDCKKHCDGCDKRAIRCEDCAAALAHPAQARDEMREENERLRARIADLESFLGFVETNNCNYCGASVVLMGADFLEDIMTALDKAGAPRKSPDGMIHYSMFDRIAALSSDKGEER